MEGVAWGGGRPSVGAGRRCSRWCRSGFGRKWTATCAALTCGTASWRWPAAAARCRGWWRCGAEGGGGARRAPRGGRWRRGCNSKKSSRASRTGSAPDGGAVPGGEAAGAAQAARGAGGVEAPAGDGEAAGRPRPTGRWRGVLLAVLRQQPPADTAPSPAGTRGALDGGGRGGDAASARRRAGDGAARPGAAASKARLGSGRGGVGRGRLRRICGPRRCSGRWAWSCQPALTDADASRCWRASHSTQTPQFRAMTEVQGHDRQGLGRMCRYGARGPVSERRLEKLEDRRRARPSPSRRRRW